MSDRFKKIFFPASIFILWVILFSEVLVGKTAWISQMFILETWPQWLPYKEFIAYCWQAGIFPLWTHNLECGFPLASFPHSGSFYVFNFVYVLSGYGAAVSISSFFHEMILSYSSYFCAREIGLSRPASWVAALTFGLTGIAFVSAGSHPLHNTICWLPPVFLFSLRFTRSPRFLNLIGLLFCSLLQVTAGDLEQIAYQDAIIFIYLVFVAGRPRRNILAWMVIIMIALVAASAQMLPFINLLNNSYRQSLAGPLPSPSPGLLPMFPLLLLFPFRFPFQSQLMPSSFYLGFAFLLGLIMAWKHTVSRREIKILLLSGFIALLYFLNIWPLSDIEFMKLVPPDARFKLLGPFQFWMIMAAGSGIDWLCRPQWTKEQYLTVRNFLIAFGLFTLLLTSASLLAPEVDILGKNFPDPSTLLLIPYRAVFAILAIIFAALIVISMKKTAGFRAPVFFLCLLFIADVFPAAWSLRPRQFLEEIKNKPSGYYFMRRQDPASRIHYISYFKFEPALWRFHDLHEGPGYIHSVIRIGLKNISPLLFEISGGDFNLMGIEHVNAETKPILDGIGAKYLIARAPAFWGMNPRPLHPDFIGSPRPFRLGPGEEMKLSVELFPGDRLGFRARPAGEREKQDKLPLGLYLALKDTTQEIPVRSEPAGPGRETVYHAEMDVPFEQQGEIIFKYTADQGRDSFIEINDAYIDNGSRPFQLLYKNDGIGIYENSSAWPKYFIALEEVDGPDPGSDLPEIIEYNPLETELKVSSDMTARLVILESYYPGWRAFVDGNEKKIYRANRAFQAVDLPAGRHIVRLSYEPLDFEIGLWFSAASILALVLIVVLFLGKIDWRKGWGHE